MPLESNVRTRKLNDPVTLRAIAHPIRLRLTTLVAREGTLTAADAARQLGISHALASHHLRQLAKYGFVEPAEAPDNRAHPWRVTAISMEFVPAEPDALATTDFLERYAVDQAAEHLAQWQDRRAGDDPAWAKPAGVRSGLIYLTPAELTEVLDAWAKIVNPLVLRRPIGHHDERPADTSPVELTLVAVPLARTEQGG